MIEIPDILVFTDGSSRGNPGPGGYGIIIQKFSDKRCKEFSKGFRKTTNNRMELLAVIEAVKKLKVKNLKVHVYTDSKYVVDAVEKQWVFNWEKKGYKGKKNSDLWKSFLSIYQTQEIRFFWIKGHNNHPQNERCDQLAFEASKLKNLNIDYEYEKEYSK